MNAAMLANPIGLLVAGIVVAAGAIYTYWEPIKGFFSGLWDGVKSAFSTTCDWMKELLSFTPLGLITNHWGAISGFFPNLWGGILDQARSALDWLLSKFEAVTGFIGDTWNTVAGWFSDDDKENPQKTTPRNPDLKPVALAATIAAATLPATAMAANQAAPIQHADHSTHSYQLTIQQLPVKIPRH